LIVAHIRNPASLLVVILICGTAHAAVQVTADQWRQEAIYHSPEHPGYSAWCTLWREPNGSLRLAFEQVTGPVADRLHRSIVTVLMGSDDEAKTWHKLREIGARPNVFDDHGIYAEAVSSSFCGHAIAVLDHGVLITGLWQGGDRAAGYLQRSADDGKTWSDPIYPLDPARDIMYPTQIRRLHDGRLMLVAGVVSRANVKTQQYLIKEFFESRDDGRSWKNVWTMPPEVGACEESDLAELPNGDLLVVHRAEHYQDNKYISSTRLQNVFHRTEGGWQIGPVKPCPFPHSGFPELLATADGIVLHIATDGVWWTGDAGEHWGRLGLAASPYYPRALQLKDGSILIVGHVGGDNVYGSVDQTIMQQTFRLTMQK
jgi:hypothetical protein